MNAPYTRCRMDKVVNVRLANKVIWALEDIGVTSIHALGMWEKALERAELKCADPALLVALSRIKGDLAEIRMLALAARQGEYAGRARVVEDDGD